MASTWQWWADAGLTVPLTRVDFSRGSAAAPVDRVVYFGSNAASVKLQDATNPGVDSLQVTVADTTPASGVEVADVKLALSAGGLASATPGAPLNIGTTLLSGAGNAVAVHARVTSAITANGNYDDVSFSVANWLESAV